MIECQCCIPPKSYSVKKALYKHQKKYDPNFVPPSRTPAKDAYEANPIPCHNCEEPISYEGYRSAAGDPKFCSKSCAATVNNKIFPKRIKEHSGHTPSRKSIRNVGGYALTCLGCGLGIIRPRKQKYCSMECNQKHIWEMAKSDPNTVWTSKRRKKQLLEELGNQCQKCMNTEWNGLPIAIEIEHINGISSDNSRENTTLLCPNCHSQTPTYKNKNKGNGRAFRRQRYKEGKSY